MRVEILPLFLTLLENDYLQGPICDPSVSKSQNTKLFYAITLKLIKKRIWRQALYGDRHVHSFFGDCFVSIVNL